MFYFTGVYYSSSTFVTFVAFVAFVAFVTLVVFVVSVVSFTGYSSVSVSTSVRFSCCLKGQYSYRLAIVSFNSFRYARIHSTSSLKEFVTVVFYSELLV